jgi:UDP-N-acetylglucosamine transferase subunit ALG13
MEQLTENARVVIAHAAAGAVILALKLSKPLVLVPRAKRFGEHIDDHQQQLAAALSADNQAVSVVEPTPATLQQAIVQCTYFKPACLSNRSLVLSLKRQLNQWNTVKTLDP